MDRRSYDTLIRWMHEMVADPERRVEAPVEESPPAAVKPEIQPEVGQKAINGPVAPVQAIPADPEAATRDIPGKSGKPQKIESESCVRPEEGRNIAGIASKTPQAAGNSPVAGPGVAGGESRPWKPRRGHKQLKGFEDRLGLARRIVQSLREYGGDRYPVRKTVLYRALTLNRYPFWKGAFGLLLRSEVIRVDKKGVLLLKPLWGEIKPKKPRKRRKRTPWFEEKTSEFLDRDGLENTADEG
jgi:hypothetical protein